MDGKTIDDLLYIVDITGVVSDWKFNYSGYEGLPYYFRTLFLIFLITAIFLSLSNNPETCTFSGEVSLNLLFKLNDTFSVDKFLNSNSLFLFSLIFPSV